MTVVIKGAGQIEGLLPSGIDSANAIGYTPAGTGAVATTVQAKLRETVSVKDFGAVGDGVTDDTAAIVAALAAVSAGDTIYFPDGEYLTTASIVVDKSVNFVGSGQARIVSDASKILDITPASAVLTTTLNGATSAGARTITLASVAGISAGQILVLEDSATLWPYDPRAGCFYGEVNIIASVNSGTSQVTLEWPTATNYNTGISVKVWAPIENLRVENLYFERKTKTSNTASGITTYALKNAYFVNCTFEGFGAVCIQDSYSSHTRINGCSFLNTWYTGVGLGYGVLTVGSVHTLVSNCRSYNARRCVDFSGSIPSRYGLAVGCMAIADYAYTDTTAFGTHGTAQYCTFKSCTSSAARTGFILRGADLTVDGCSVYNGTLFATCTSGLNHTFIGCTLDGQPAAAGFPPSGFVDATSANYLGGANSLIIKGCFAKIASYFLYINDNVVDGVSFELTDNSVGLRSTATNFVSTANLASAKTFNIFVRGNNGYRNDTNGQYLLRMSAGTNATLDERTLESWSVNFFYTARRAAIPTTGTWRQGDIVWNTAPAAGGAPGWVCTTGGTPGTWKAMANLAV
jgi:Pectate lyase superfamily protein